MYTFLQVTRMRFFFWASKWNVILVKHYYFFFSKFMHQLHLSSIRVITSSLIGCLILEEQVSNMCSLRDANDI